MEEDLFWDLAINTKPKVDLAEVLRKSDDHLKELQEQLEEEERPARLARLRRGFE